MENLEFVLAALVDIADECDNRNLIVEADEITDTLNYIIRIAEINKKSYIKTVKEDGKTKYEVKSKKNPDWNGGTYSTKEEAEKRLAEIEMLKHLKNKK